VDFIARLAWVFLLVALVVLAPSCQCQGQASQSDTGPSVASGTVEAPAGLVLEIAAPHPEQAWQKLRIALGGSAFFLPKSLGALLAKLVGMPITVAQEIDGDVPMLGAAILDPETSALHAVLGFHVKAGERLVVTLTKGNEAPFSARPDAASGVTLLESRGESPAGVSLGVFHNYLLLGRAPGDLTRLGPYVARALPARAPAHAGDVVMESGEDAARAVKIAGAQLERALSLLSLPPPLGATMLAEPLVAAIAVLEDADRVRLTWVLDEHAARCEIVLTPRGGDGPLRRLARSLVRRAPGDAAGILELPGDTLAAWGQHRKVEGPDGGKDDAAAWLSGLGAGELPSEDREALRSALSALADGRGEWFVLGVRVGELGPAVFAKSAVEDAARLRAGLDGLWHWIERPGVRGHFTESSLSAEPEKTRVERLVGEVDRVRLRLLDPRARPPGGDHLPDKVDVLFLPREDPSELLIAAGYDSPDALRVIASPPEPRFGDLDAVRALVGPAAERSAMIGLVDVARLRDVRLGRPPRTAPALVVVSIGSEQGSADVVAELSLARSALPELARLARIL
jgi:hypothetical protein